jgi:FtsZ-binding cell division protein ZapB
MIVTEDIAEEVLKPVEEVDVEALKEKIATLTAEVEKLTAQQEAVLNENVELKAMSASTKLKAEVKGQSPITMKTKEVSTDSTLDALSRITKKNNK